VLAGREEDRAALDDLVGSLRKNLSGTLVLIGEPGIGKTSLLACAVDAAGDLHVTRISGVESEVQLGFAALHRLLLPFLDRAEHLPARQRDALGAAFRLVAETPADRFLVGLAVLGLLAEAAATRPVLCVVDDAQWIDRESLEVLGFVGRRLHADGIGLLFGVREAAAGLTALDGLPARRIGGLDETAAGELLAATAPGRLDPRVAARIVAGTGGNPLALIEVAGALSARQLAGGAALPAQLPVGGRLEEHFVRQVRALPEPTRLLLLLASAHPGDDPAVIWRSGTRLGLGPDAADPALVRGILSSQRTFAFRHPLIRSAVYEAASPADRRRVHAALGEVIDRDRDPDRRAWHRAEATWAPDEEVAAELERSAERAGRRGGYSGQAVFLARAAELTPDAGVRTRRLLAAAQAHLVAGDAGQAQALLERAAPDPGDSAAQITVRGLRANLEMLFVRLAGVPSLLLEAVDAVGSADAPVARDMLFDALVIAQITREHTVGTTLGEVARRALAAAPPDPGHAEVPDLFLAAQATRVTSGYRAALPLVRAAVAALGGDGAIPEKSWALAHQGCSATEDLWDDAGRRGLLHRLEAHCRERGALRTLGDTLAGLATGELWAGRFGVADAHQAEAAEVYRAVGVPGLEVSGQVELLAWQGRDVELRALAGSLEREWGEQRGLAVMAVLGRFGLGLLDLARGRYAEALVHARRVYDDDPPGYGSRVLPDVVEAGVRSGDRAAAAAALDRLTERATASGTDWALGVLARSRALLADDDRADDLYRRAAAHLGRTTVATELARTHLLHGEWLRRRQRQGDARVELRTAHDRFATMGAVAFAERARAELLATGERVGKRGAGADHRLTPQESQVARLAAAGSTNSEIAQRLFVTSSTVEYHLSKVFRKLGVTSRRELTDALPD
jgi:DNA-binding CsgD family transcriptional regulator